MKIQIKIVSMFAVIIGIFVTLIMITPNVLKSYGLDSIDINYRYDKIASLIDFNNDGFLDTLLSQKVNSSYVPVCFCWGNNQDTNYLNQHSLFRYPNLANLECTFSVSHLDNDTTDDLMIYITGKIQVDTTLIDTNYLFVMNNSNSLRSFDTIDLTQNYDTLYNYQVIANDINYFIDQGMFIEQAYLPELNTILFTYNRIAPLQQTITFVEPDLNSNAKFKVYPNPASNDITIECNSFIGTEDNLKIYRFDGVLIMDSKIRQNVGNKLTINLNDWLNGLYYIVISGSDVDYKTKFLLIK